MKPDLKDHYILITGAGRGLGRHLAEHLAACGAVVGVSDIDAATCTATVADLISKGYDAHAYVGGVILYLVMLIVVARISHPVIAGMALMFCGGAGNISVTANVAPRAMHEMCVAALKPEPARWAVSPTRSAAAAT